MEIMHGGHSAWHPEMPSKPHTLSAFALALLGSWSALGSESGCKVWVRVIVRVGVRVRARVRVNTYQQI